MACTQDPDDRRAPFDDVVRFFGNHWAGFWAWLERIGQNARPMPSASRGSSKGTTEDETDFPVE